jgi:hypothetical protein
MAPVAKGTPRLLRPQKQSARRTPEGTRRAELSLNGLYLLRWFSAWIRPSMPFWLICWANWLR